MVTSSPKSTFTTAESKTYERPIDCLCPLIGPPNDLCLSCAAPPRGSGRAARRLLHLTLTHLQAPRRRTKSAVPGAKRWGEQRRGVSFWQKLGRPLHVNAYGQSVEDWHSFAILRGWAKTPLPNCYKR